MKSYVSTIATRYSSPVRCILVLGLFAAFFNTPT